MSVAAVIGLGASLGDRRAAISLGVQALEATQGLRVRAVSRLYLSPPLGRARCPFLNAAVLVDCALGPVSLLARCRAIERRMGRRPALRWSDRALDLDVLLYGDLVRRGCALVVPHAGLLARPFALLPARDAAPWFVHPIAKRTLAGLARGVEGALPVGVLDAPAPGSLPAA